MEFLNNPWFHHFKQAQIDELDRCLTVILAPEITPLNQIIREQIIGEARAYKVCAEYPEKTHKKITNLKERKQDVKEPNEYPLI